jgi:hypothetical protein
LPKFRFFKNLDLLITIIVTVLFILIILVRTFGYRRKSLPARSFAAALKDENNGDYESALNGYEVTLMAMRKSKGYRSLRIKILEKIKLLHTVIDYRKNLFTVNQWISRTTPGATTT